MEYNGYPLPAIISDQSLDAEYSRVWALEEYALNLMYPTDQADVQVAQQVELSTTSKNIVDYLTTRGYPLPVMTDESISTEFKRVRALEDYAKTMYGSSTDIADLDESVLSTNSMNIIAYLENRGYELPELSDKGLETEFARVRALETYATETMYGTYAEMQAVSDLPSYEAIGIRAPEGSSLGWPWLSSNEFGYNPMVFILGFIVLLTCVYVAKKLLSIGGTLLNISTESKLEQKDSLSQRFQHLPKSGSHLSSQQNKQSKDDSKHKVENSNDFNVTSREQLTQNLESSEGDTGSGSVKNKVISALKSMTNSKKNTNSKDHTNDKLSDFMDQPNLESSGQGQFEPVQLSYASVTVDSEDPSDIYGHQSNSTAAAQQVANLLD